jgi:hypothetical protein
VEVRGDDLAVRAGGGWPLLSLSLRTERSS